MKSDLIGRVYRDFKTSTLYLERKTGVVILTNFRDPMIGTVVHVRDDNKKFKLGMQVDIIEDDQQGLEVLGGKIELSNF
jgi:hypothetical protein